MMYKFLFLDSLIKKRVIEFILYDVPVIFSDCY